MNKKIFSIIVALMAIASGAQAQNSIDGHAYVDLGLPSGTLWATMNVGASSITDVGDKFAWGETETKSEFTWDNYKWKDQNKTSLSLSDDAAYVNWSDKWCMPTKAQVEELMSKCTISYNATENNPGTTLTGPNGKTIFFPAWIATKWGAYWTSDYYGIVSGYPDAYYLLIYNDSKNYYVSHKSCYNLGMIRPVVRTKTISDIPDGWTVNGLTPIDGKVNVRVGKKVKVTPANLPVGKKVKSIKLVPTE